MLRTYIIWNPSMVDALNARGGPGRVFESSTLDGLKEAEELTGKSISSHVTTHNIKEVISLAENECNTTLSYAEVENESQKVQVVMFSTELYTSYQNASGNGAITSLGTVYPAELEVVSRTFDMASGFDGNSRAIGTLINGVFTEL
jgi:hypothetical protein